MICLDANVVIGVMNDHPRPLVERFDREVLGGGLALPTIVLFELVYGLAKSSRRNASEARLATFLDLPIKLLTFDADDARDAGEIRAALAHTGMPIGPYDVLIAAQARRRGATLVTANTREFSRVPGLRLEDWTVG